MDPRGLRNGTPFAVPSKVSHETGAHVEPASSDVELASRPVSVRHSASTRSGWGRSSQRMWGSSPSRRSPDGA